jgi:hypothetical protein
MEKTSESTEVGCVVSGYHLSVGNSHNRLCFRAYSETLGRLFEEELTDETLPANLKDNYV